jgi:hypothetical protein
MNYGTKRNGIEIVKAGSYIDFLVTAIFERTFLTDIPRGRGDALDHEDKGRPGTSAAAMAHFNCDEQLSKRRNTR